MTGPTSNEAPLLDVENLAVEIDGRNGKARVVDGISFQLKRGETLGVVGESGCGKSLTMLSLVGLLPNRIRVAGGKAKLGGRDLLTMSQRDLRAVRGGEIGFIFQDPMTSLNPVLRIGQQLCEPIYYHRGLSRAAAHARAVELLGLAVEEAARLQLAAQGEAVQVQGDERLLRRALRNLLENAQRYGGGQVEVQVRRTSGGAEISVCDRGPGVPEAYRERIFEAFFRLPGHAEREGGVGLGLALVRQIALAHGGSVRCEPRDGGGSCFRLSLPQG